MRGADVHDPRRPDEIQQSQIKSKEIRLLKRSRMHTRTARRDQDAGCIYVQIRERYQMHEYYQTAAGSFITATMDLITDPRSFKSSFIDVWFSYLVLK